MSVTTRDMAAVQELRAEQRQLEAEMFSAPACGHSLGSLPLVCRQCWRHDRCDAIDRAIERLLRHQGVAS